VADLKHGTNTACECLLRALSCTADSESMEMKCEFLNECWARAMLARAVSLMTVCSYSVPAVDGLHGQNCRLRSQNNDDYMYIGALFVSGHCHCFRLRRLIDNVTGE
jgi:hypothetical protein